MAQQKLTDWMRINLNISRPTGRPDEVNSDEYLRLQRENILKHAQFNDLCDFKEVISCLRGVAKSQSVTEKEINDRIRDLLAISQEMLGIARSESLIESGAMFILQMFHDSIYINKLLGTINEHRLQLGTVFDSRYLTGDMMSRAYEQSKFLLKLLETSSEFSFLFTSQANSPSNYAFGRLTEPEPILELEWGPDVVMSPYNLRVIENLSFLEGEKQQLFVEWDSLLSPKKKQLEIDFSYHQKSHNSNHEAMETSQDSNGHGPGVDTSWLFTKLKIVLQNSDIEMECNDFFEMVQAMLMDSEKADQEIEEDLLGLLGASNVIFIREIISSRRDIVNSFSSLFYQPTSATSDNYTATAMALKSQLPLIKPVLNPADKRNFRGGQSIVVQTEEEKQMQKLLRKIEKRAGKEISKEQKDSNGTINMSELERMKAEREQALLNAMYSPLFTGKEAEKPAKYEYVFDSYTEAKQSAAFISGHKITLPEGFNRRDDRKWEEVNIPPPNKPQGQIVDKYPLKKTSELDAIGQKCFAGVERLNQIQSIVFETAYNTNENMLVCAPTGAGKTNIAMLTVAKVLKDNLNANGKINKDKFKVIYIAPMKALAAEMTENFGRRLKPFEVVVRELTGDMQLTRQEIIDTQMIVTTPEKWDVVTRKSGEDMNAHLVKLVKLLIIDEVHLLQSDRGPVLEALVARTIRHVEACQKMTRLVGLSATLPNYVDVALFLSVSLNRGMFFFDNRFRPVPLELSFVGCKASQSKQQRSDMDEVCYDKVKSMVEKGEQVMVFVHARNATHKLADYLRDEASKQGHSLLFASDSPELSRAVDKTRNKVLRELLPNGFAVHHAGILRQDRNLVERVFKDGLVKVLVCTSTLAWGVNLPAHAVIIRGTEVYDSAHGEYVDVSMLDVMQIFGRAGRPQYDTSGYACIITSHDKLQFYLSMLTNQYPIESNFIKYLADNLNAEIVSRTVTSIDDAVEWMNYTYLLIRMQRNPLAYGLTYDQLKNDPHLFNRRRELAIDAAMKLNKAMMIRFDDDDAGNLDATDLGRTASFYYIKYDTIERFNSMISEDMEEDKILNMLCHAQEFDQLKTREDEIDELMDLKKRACPLKVSGGVDTKEGKVNILLQAYLSNWRLDSFSLISDNMFVNQNIVRMSRGLFDYVIKSGWAHLSDKLLTLSKMFEQQMWAHQSPLRQFYSKELDFETLRYLDRDKDLTAERLRSDNFASIDIGHRVRNQSKGTVIKKLAHMLPWLIIEATAQPMTKTYVRRIGDQDKKITSHVVKFSLDITPDFSWNDQHHGKSQRFWLWVQDYDSTTIRHHLDCFVQKKQAVDKETKQLHFSIPLTDITRVPSHYILHVDSDRFLGCDIDEDVICKELIEIHE